MRNSKLRIVTAVAGAVLALGATAGCDFAQGPQQEDQQEQQDGDQQQEDQQQDGEQEGGEDDG
ncbi:hypothetical protein EIL87_17800 [Saccharopolyspora rhizosphaerae]|uniref:Uncharacterized protein n=1 Tax=Saccharopolyspora rhizosphaerae TaxID=2492662 RepID=A0A3R8PZA5_9PSEU|nr:hypothetical protein [Saccharopolyspora rhizosphaerae]RRO15123.1 hypothetical protein EIL87_17800 [Saccharopolyspora rhizosphaerae]